VPDNADADFLAELLDELEATLCVDTGRIFSIGMSNGAQMSSLIACRFGERLAGIVPIAGVEFNEPCDGPPVPVVAFHGDADPIVPYEGGGLNSVTIADQNFYEGDVPPSVPVPTGVEESMDGWAAHNGCDPEPTEERLSDEVRLVRWEGCDARTELYVVEGGGHQWPGRPQEAFAAQFGPGTTDVDATALFLALIDD
jgi:polyhydroxybutyrate depolymerase